MIDRICFLSLCPLALVRAVSSELNEVKKCSEVKDDSALHKFLIFFKLLRLPVSYASLFTL